MKLSKVIFKTSVDGIFGESVNALVAADAHPSMRCVVSLEVGTLGLIVTTHKGTVHWVPASDCRSGDVLLEEPEAKPAKGGKAA